ncbi:Ig-like domain-containing protein [Pseudomonas chlororaphis]|nr:Ig-like domain-containing protein [Pseudomonas chlororaphis]
MNRRRPSHFLFSSHPLNLKRLLLASMVLIIWGCTAQQAGRPLTERSPSSAHSHFILAGQETATRITQRYRDTRPDCGAPSRPAFLCTGIILRGTNPSPDYHAWNPSNLSVTSGGVSFSYLRTDAKYKGLAYSYKNGFFFSPYLASAGKVHPEVLCSFAIDGHTFERPTDKGCGAHIRYTDSGLCRNQGITTAAQWLTHYDRVTGNPQRQQHQCAFDVRDALNEQATSAFNASIAAMKLIPSESFATQNELRIATWAQNIPTQLPLEAFFYVDDGLAGAQYYQRDFYQATGVTVPIIRMTLPAVAANDATFEFRAQDQVDQNELVIAPSVMVLDGLSIKASWPRLRDSVGNAATRLPTGGHPPYRYVSSAPAVVSVNAAGKVVGERTGSATITVYDVSNTSVSYPVLVGNVFLLGIQPYPFADVHAANAWVASQGGHSPGLAGATDLAHSFGLPLPPGTIGAQNYWLLTTEGCPAGMSLYYAYQTANYGCGYNVSAGLGALYMIRY